MSILPNFFQNARVIGRGAFGVVYMARNTRENRTCALKQINADNDTVQAEITALAQLRGHDGVVTFHRALRYQGSVWLEMEYCEEGSLNTFYTRNRGRHDIINPPLIFRFMKETISALQYLHRNGIAHRDLKPDNILISSGTDGIHHTKITDFGLAKVISDRLYNGNILSFYMTSGVGTMFFMAPEVINGSYTIKVDIFAMGLIFSSLIMGAWSQRHGLFLAVMHGGSPKPIGLIQSCNPQFQYTLPGEFPASLRMKVLLQSMLSADHHHRPSAEDVMGILNGMNDSDDIRTSNPGATPYQTFACVDRINWWKVGGIVAIILLVLFGFWPVLRWL
ncbi:serine/threonine-protein kinase pdik1l-A-like [Amphiura filiformis]|uniref:serine/threonine-protein kinase pdik1l-A-like n=1 Tax=Amphiura filiformis TaxID=82378 RepID=UPI003B21B5FC